jgi:hypothetical protein
MARGSDRVDSAFDLVARCLNPPLDSHLADTGASGRLLWPTKSERPWRSLIHPHSVAKLGYPGYTHRRLPHREHLLERHCVAAAPCGKHDLAAQGLCAARRRDGVLEAASVGVAGTSEHTRQAALPGIGPVLDAVIVTEISGSPGVAAPGCPCSQAGGSHRAYWQRLPRPCHARPPAGYRPRCGAPLT